MELELIYLGKYSAKSKHQFNFTSYVQQFNISRQARAYISCALSLSHVDLIVGPHKDLVKMLACLSLKKTEEALMMPKKIFSPRWQLQIWNGQHKKIETNFHLPKLFTCTTMSQGISESNPHLQCQPFFNNSDWTVILSRESKLS